MEKDLNKRKRNRLENYDYSSVGAYFLTICTENRKNFFWRSVGATIGRPPIICLSPCGHVVEEAIQNISNIYPSVNVDAYVIMPNHIHLLITISADEYGRPMVAPTMSRIVQQMKGYVSKRIGHSIWQKLFYDHVIRNQNDYDEHLRYIQENPIRWRADELYTEN